MHIHTHTHTHTYTHSNSNTQLRTHTHGHTHTYTHSNSHTHTHTHVYGGQLQEPHNRMLEEELNRKEEKIIYYKRFIDDTFHMIEGPRATVGSQRQSAAQPPTKEGQ